MFSSNSKYDVIGKLLVPDLYAPYYTRRMHQEQVARFFLLSPK